MSWICWIFDKLKGSYLMNEHRNVVFLLSSTNNRNVSDGKIQESFFVNITTYTV